MCIRDSINDACLKIENGQINASIILGGEARYKQLRSIIEKKEYSETKLDENPDFYIKAKEDLYGEEELAELGAMAVGYYAAMETAIRKNDGETIDDHQNNIASMYEEFSKIASNNKDGWIDNPYSKEEILNSSKKNKMLAYPYNKLHCTSWNVNQSAALIAWSIRRSASSRFSKLPFCCMAETPITTDLCFIYFILLKELRTLQKY